LESKLPCNETENMVRFDTCGWSWTWNSMSAVEFLRAFPVCLLAPFIFQFVSSLFSECQFVSVALHSPHCPFRRRPPLWELLRRRRCGKVSRCFQRERKLPPGDHRE
jgi:hypothetical protein